MTPEVIINRADLSTITQYRAHVALLLCHNRQEMCTFIFYIIVWM